MTPSETPIPSEVFERALAVEQIVIGLGFVILGFVMVWAVIRVSQSEPRAMMAVIVGLLTFVAMIAFALTGEEVLGTLAATGLGALAGAVTNLFDALPNGDDQEK